jgi:hypothetical protein
MKNVVIFTVLICLTVKSFGQVKITALDKAAIPKSIKYTGHIINSVTYSDKDGEHLVITTESGTIPSKGPDSDNFRNEELHAYHYKKTAGELKLTWQTYGKAIKRNNQSLPVPILYADRLTTPLRTCYDINYYHLDVKFDIDKKFISGNVLFKFTARSDFTKLQFDLWNNLKIEKVVYKGQELKYTREFNAVFLTFPKNHSQGQ